MVGEKGSVALPPLAFPRAAGYVVREALARTSHESIHDRALLPWPIWMLDTCPTPRARTFRSVSMLDRACDSRGTDRLHPSMLNRIDQPLVDDDQGGARIG